MQVIFDFSNTNVVVVGGTSGINRGVAQCFAKAGAKVAVMSRSQEKVDDTKAALLAAGAAQALGYSVDVRDSETLHKCFGDIAEKWGRIDVLVSGAAGNFPALAKDLSENGFKSVVDIDLLGTFHVMKAAFAYLKKPGASIINISAPQAFLPMQAQVHVCAAKAGVDMITKTLALEWGEQGVRLNSIVPGPIEGTEGMKRLAPTPELMQMAKDSVPLARLGEPDDIGRAAMFLASDAASYVSGAIFPVDGGWSLGGASGLSETLVGMMKKMAGD